ncbi:oxidoreductase [Erythrobacter sp. SAORIC-644]|uniref:SDR family oxidoreductase n=1 Tax=Erythrobacter sp. SAORIC-644 TaxID=1869314 RepID=UPI000C9F0F9A|nr:SDR family oxidoreductase [Erythrobacter sp. SAORIC-644]PNQ77812.1 oxidoreductase [Erythrobacter sp. SAORIC-644]
MQTSGNTILITGGGSGIGRELAHKWHDLGNTVIVAGRTRASLDETAAGHANIHTMIVDVGDAEDIARFAKKVVEVHPAINVLVNNAGIMRFEDITEERELGDAEATIATNLLGPIRLIDGLIEHLKAQKNAAIINVTSGLAFVPMPRTATYSATKAAMHSYTVSLRAKLEGKVEVIELAPPAVQTELTPGQSTREGYMPLDEFIEETMLGFTAEETPQEVLTQNVLFLRNAEAEGRFDKALEMTSKF